MTPLILAVTRNDVANYVSAVFYVYGLVLFAYILTSMIFSFGGRIPYSRWSRAILDFLRDVSEPYLRPFRAIVPQFGMFDFSPIIAFIVLGFVGRIVVGLIRG